MSRHKARPNKRNHHKAKMALGHCASCGGKETHETRRQADEIIRTMRRRGYQPDPDCRFDSYPCPVGSGFHVGNKPLTAKGPNLNDPRLRFLEDT